MAEKDRGIGLLDDASLDASAVVANCAMNRERQLAGVNSYARELGFSPLDVLIARIGEAGDASTTGWLDLCCGSGRALIQAASQLQAAALAGRVTVTGVDLVDAFDPVPAPLPGLELICATAATWQPDRSYDLITCVHGLHYIGDKLTVLARAASWLTPHGHLAADLDLSAIYLGENPAAARRLAARLRTAGFTYNPRRHQITCTGRRDLSLPYVYLGADDRVGPGYTGQPAVRSHYAEQPGSGRAPNSLNQLLCAPVWLTAPAVSSAVVNSRASSRPRRMACGSAVMSLTLERPGVGVEGVGVDQGQGHDDQRPLAGDLADGREQRDARQEQASLQPARLTQHQRRKDVSSRTALSGLASAQRATPVLGDGVMQPFGIDGRRVE